MQSERGSLEGKVAIVTGAGTGLGKAMALSLARAGANIVAAARRLPLIEGTAQEVRALGRRALAIPTDVTNSQQVNQMVERTVAEMGRLDILVNNAGIVRGERRKPIEEITDEEWRLGMDTNLSGAFYCSRAVAKHLIDQRSGKVINIASVAGLRGMRDGYMYGCAKAGVIQLTRCLALTWAPYNIQVNCIAPGPVDVSADASPERATSRSRRAQFLPVGYVGVPQDIGGLALFLASEASDYITGGLFISDGGAMAGGHAPTGYAPNIPMKEG